jgi:hypothetical protein
MASGRPDYTSQSLIKGSDAGTHRTVAVDPAGNLLTLIKGQFGGAPVTIAVDAGGNILGVLQGDYAGSLKTLAVDDKGRMLAVLTDPEDVFGNPHYMGAAELAARLGSPYRMTRTGQVIFMDPGGVNLGQYTVVKVGAAADVIHCASNSPLEPLCYRLQPGAVDGDYCQLLKKLPRASSTGKVGVELSITIETDLDSIVLSLASYAGAAYLNAQMKLDLITEHAYLLVTGGAWEDLGAVGALTSFIPICMKFTYDVDTGLYSTARISGNSWGVAALEVSSGIVARQPHLYLGIKTESSGAGNPYLYLSNIIVTMNED